MKINKKILIIMFVTLLFLISFNLLAVDFGGKLRTYLSGTIDGDGSINSDFSQNLDLELFLPSYGDSSAAVHFVLHNPELINQWGDSSRINFKKLYLRHRFDDFRVTIGRQPISWSFGSLINPIDFSLGAEALDQEGMAKYQDAVNLRYSINWNSNLELIAARLPSSDNYKWGFRGRTNFKGFDLTANYVKEPGFNLALFDSMFAVNDTYNNTYSDTSHNEVFSEMNLLTGTVDRLGLSFKGDIGSFGTHGALGYYDFEILNNPAYVFLLGGDYSFSYDYNKRIVLQMEYLAFQHEILENPLLLAQLGELGKRLDLMTASINYPIDDFSSLALMSMVSLDDGSFMLMPVYENELPGNINLSLMSSISFGDEGEMFAGYNNEDEKSVGFELSLSYAF